MIYNLQQGDYMNEIKKFDGDFVPRKSNARYNYPLRLPSALKPRVHKAAKQQERSIASYILVALVEKLERDEKQAK
jgi:hypothetical protein